MRLTELNPKWIAVGDNGEIIYGVRFDCPHCRSQRLVVQFDPPIDPQNVLHLTGGNIYADQPTWRRISGDTFETLTMSPSIDVSFEGHWHGFIENGEVRP